MIFLSFSISSLLTQSYQIKESEEGEEKRIFTNTLIITNTTTIALEHNQIHVSLNRNKFSHQYVTVSAQLQTHIHIHQYTYIHCQ